jgi:sugar lactone lactonase YvrE
MDSRRVLTVLGTVAAVAAGAPSTASAAKPPKVLEAQELATFAAPGCESGCGQGSTVGPDKALYVTDGPGGRVLRVNPKTGAITTFASGLPLKNEGPPIGAATDVVFAGGTAYVLVTLVGPFFGQEDVVGGIYRIEQDGTATPIADIGAWSLANPPATPFAVTTGVQYAVERFRDGFVVTDGHHNRVLRVRRSGAVSLMRAFGDIVPTGLDVRGRTIYMAEAGQVPHEPEDGKVVRFTPKTGPSVLASGAPLITDVEFGRVQRLFALSQGFWDLPPDPENAGAPASPDTGALVKVDRDGGFTTIVDGLDRPTSLEFIGTTAFVVTYDGTVVRIDGAASPPFGGRPH